MGYESCFNSGLIEGTFVNPMGDYDFGNNHDLGINSGAFHNF